MRMAMHVHTNVSACSESSVQEIADYCHLHEIDAIAITDHNDTEGALKLQSIAPWLKVIVGEEVTTREGELIGLFLKRTVKPALSLRETCEQIKDQGGLTYVPHPKDRFKVHRVPEHHLAEVIDLIDIIEIYNAKTSFPIYNRRARKLAQKYGKVGAVGSDSHYVKAIGSALIIIDPFEGPQDFLRKLSRAELKKGVASLLATWWIRVRKLRREKQDLTGE